MLKRLKNRLKKKQLIRSLGVHDTFTACVAERAGFELLFVGGFGVTASSLGMPDLGLVTLTEMAAAVRRIATRVAVPVIADGDTGHGGVHNVQRTVQEFEAAGAAGVILEDQVSPKRCGHFRGKSVISADDMVIKLKAALAARKSRDFIIVARTDARDTHGINEAIRRANLYHRSGADVVFIESPGTEKELERIPQNVKAPLLVNMLTGGKTPLVSCAKIEKMGYKIVVYPIESLLITATAVQRLAQSILMEGSVDSVRSEMITFDDARRMLWESPIKF